MPSRPRLFRRVRRTAKNPRRRTAAAEETTVTVRIPGLAERDSCADGEDGEEKPPVDPRDGCCAPVFGDWRGVCPLYLTVGASEVLLDDALGAAAAARAAGVSVKVDVHPYLFHAGPLFAGVPEAREAVVRGADFVLRHLGRRG